MSDSYQLSSPADVAAPNPITHRKGEGRMSSDDLHAQMEAIIKDCVNYVDQELSPARATARKYYFAEPFGNEEEGRSQVVLSEVRDAVAGTIPSMARVFFGPERIVEFTPNNPAQQAPAEQATDYVQRIFEVENNGFVQCVAVWKDALVGRLGGFKWWWEKDTTKVEKLYRVTQSQLDAMGQDKDLTLSEVEDLDEMTTVSPEDQQAGIQPEKLYNVETSRVDKEGRPCVLAMPPEEILFTRHARDRDHALLVGHRTELTRGELQSMGVPEDVLDEYGKRDLTLATNPEEITRRNAAGATGLTEDAPLGEANNLITYVEAYTTIDIDGDGFAELRLVKCIGPTFYPYSYEPADDIAMAFFTPDPEPHVIIGGSLADRTMDMQKTKSSVLRATLDSLSLHLYPRMGYVEGQVAVEDILNTAIGAPLRMRREGALQPVIIPFVGEESLPVLAMLDEVVERRTGKNKGVVGLDADALQSTGAAAADAAISAAQAQDEYLCRVFAEMCLKPLFRGLLRLLTQYQPRERMVKLRGKWVNVDPRAWDADWGVEVNVALGTQNLTKKLQVLDALATKQEQVLQMFGPSNPIFSVSQYSNVIRKALNLNGWKDTSQFMNVVPDNWQPPQQAPQPTPEQTLAQAQLQMEQMKTQRELAIKEAELQQKQRQVEVDRELRIREMAMENELKRLAINAQFATQTSEQQAEAEAEQNRAWLEGQRAMHQAALAEMSQRHEQMLAEHKLALQTQDQAHTQQLTEMQHAHDRLMAEHAAALAEKKANSTGKSSA